MKITKEKGNKISLSTEEIVQLLKKELNLSLAKKGKDYFGLCPFHKEKTSSFAFEPEKKIFKCFGCGFSAGNVFKLWAEYKKISLSQVKKELNQLGYYVGTIEEREQPEIEEKDFFSLINNIYQHNLFSIAGKEALNYLQKERNLDYHYINKFGLGCAISYKQLTNLFTSQENDKGGKKLFSLGLLRINNKNQTYDFFAPQQLIFPLINEKGKMVALASRKIGNWSENKYLYLPNYQDYQKSSFLYNYLAVRLSTELDYYYLVEGFFDVISLSQLGIKNCLALLGTNISKEQIELLKKLQKKAIIFLDGDMAGKAATIKITIALLSCEIECEVVNHNYNYDPDEICRFKKEELTEICQKREDPYLFILQHFAQTWELRENPQSVIRFIQKIAELFQSFPAHSQRFLIEKISQIINWDKKEVEEIYFTKPIKKEPIKEDNSEEIIVNDLEQEVLEKEKCLIYYCLQSRHNWLILRKKDYFFTTKENRQFYRYIYNFYTSDFHQKFDTNSIEGHQKKENDLTEGINKIFLTFTDRPNSLIEFSQFLENFST